MECLFFFFRLGVEQSYPVVSSVYFFHDWLPLRIHGLFAVDPRRSTYPVLDLEWYASPHQVPIPLFCCLLFLVSWVSIDLGKLFFFFSGASNSKCHWNISLSSACCRHCLVFPPPRTMVTMMAVTHVHPPGCMKRHILQVIRL